MFEGFYRFLNEFFNYPHPVHPTQVNMPIGLAVGALAFILGALLFRNKGLVVTTRHALMLAFLFVFPSVLAGYMDWQHFYGGVWFYPIKLKMILAGVLFILLVLGMLLATTIERKGSILAVSLAAVVTVVALGYFGAEIVFGSRAPVSAENPQGRLIFLGHCSGCHPYGGNILKPSHPVIKSPMLARQQDFIGWIRRPRPPMPSFPQEEISREEAVLLHSYLLGLWGPGKPSSHH